MAKNETVFFTKSGRSARLISGQSIAAGVEGSKVFITAYLNADNAAAGIDGDVDFDIGSDSFTFKPFTDPVEITPQGSTFDVLNFCPTYNGKGYINIESGISITNNETGTDLYVYIEDY